MAGSALRQVASGVVAPSLEWVHELAATTPLDLFEAQVRRTPDAVAVVFHDQHVTYATLDRRANQLAHLVGQRTVHADDVAAVVIEPSPQMVIALMAVWKAGAAFAPLNPADSDARLALFAERAQAVALVTDDARASLRPLADMKQLNVSAASTVSSADTPARSLHPQNAACLLFTENRSGTASGLVLTHHDLLQAARQSMSDEAATRLLCASQLPPDGFVVALCRALTTGGTLLVEAERLTSGTLWEAARSTLATHSFVSLRSIQTMDLATATGHQPVVVLGPAPSLFLSPARGPGWARGADEAVITASADDACVYVLDDALQRVPTGVVGELYVATAPAHRGLFGQPALTASQFVANPYDERGGTMYRTGSRARWRDGGLLDVVFRKPYRCPDIEGVLLEHPLVEDCLVLSRPSTEGSSEAVAYIVTSGGWAPSEFDSLIQSRLPALLMGVRHVPVKHLPFTRDGKPDVKALMNVQVIDEDLIACWEASMRERSQIEDVAVVVGERREDIPPLHVWDILSDTDAHLATTGSSTEQPREHLAASDEAKTAAPAIVHGAALRDQVRASSTLTAALRRAATEHGSTEIICLAADGSESHLSYADLLAEAELLLSGLRAEGMRPTDKVIFQFDRGPDFLAAFWACTLGGFVPVPVAISTSYTDQEAGVQKLNHAWRLLDRPVILTGGAIASRVASLQASSHFEGVSVVNLDELRRRPLADGLSYDAEPDDLALLLLTSGSTGEPKAVMLSHRNILGMSVALAESQGLSAADISLNWMPLEHVGGIVFFHLRDVFLGCRQYHAAIDYVLNAPLRWLALVNEHRVSVTWAPNFAFALINDHAQEVARQPWDLSCLRFIGNGGEMIVPATATKFMTLLAPLGLPQTAMRPAWGMSETSGAATCAQFDPLSHDTFTCVGPPIPGVSFRIVDQQNQVIGEGQIGRLHVRGVSVMRGYYARPDLTKEVFSEDGWFETGDLGFLADGALSLTGRSKDVVIVRGVNYYCHEIEAAVEGVDGVLPSYAAACAVRKPGSNTDEIAVFFVLAADGRETLGTLVRAIRKRVSDEVGITPDYVVAVSTGDIPKTAIGKIQRSALRARFEDGDFRSQLREGDIASRSQRTIPDWFYRPIWRRQGVLHARELQARKTVLVFLDEAGVGHELVRLLGAASIDCITVVPASTFGRSGPRRYELNPHEDDGYARLLRALHDEDIAVDDIVHLWAYGPDRDDRSTSSSGRDDYGIGSLLLLIQALSEQRDVVPSASLTVVSSEAQCVDRADRVSGERAMISGFLASVTHEVPWLRCRHVDVTGHDTRKDAADALRELNARDADLTVAYRKTGRMVRRLEHLEFDAPPSRPALVSGGLYVITGGLGGIATHLSEFLVSRYGAKVLLVGRSEHPAQTEQSAQTASHISYAAVDACDANAFRRAITQAEASWNTSLRGVFHLAGLFHQRSVLKETRDGLVDIARPKIGGALAIAKALSDRTGLLFVAFSSVNGYFGGFEGAAYAAASSGMEAVSSRLPWSGGVTHIIQWSRWSNVGMNKDDPFDEVSRARGFIPISVSDGLNSLLAVLQHGVSHAVVGLDGGNARIHARCESSATVIERQELCACVEDRAGTTASWLELVEPPADRFGTLSSCRLVRVPQLQRTETGQINRDALVRSIAADSGQGFEAPANETERRMARIWEELIGVSSLSATASFFEVGGHSLAATQLVARIRREFQVDVSMQQLFAAPTIRQLAALVAETRASSTPYQIVLRQLFREILGVELVGLDDSFFALGGNTRLASELVARVRTTLGADLTFPTIYDCRTVRALAARLEQGDELVAEVLDTVLPLRRRGHLTPVFCLPPAGGLGWRYAGLLGGLDTDRPLYGLQSPGIKDDNTPCPGSFDEFVTYYLNLVLSIQPSGPYCLAGWSFGGLLAFAMANRLQRMGHTVLPVVIIDAYPAPRTAAEKEPLDLILSLDPEFENKRERLKANPPPGVQPMHIDRIYDLWVRGTGLYQKFTPETFAGDVVVFSAARSTGGSAIDRAALPAKDSRRPWALWKPFVLGTLDVVPIDATHEDITEPIHLLTVGRALEERLRLHSSADAGARPPIAAAHEPAASVI
jgi:acyl-CoA synthetase (AMP-forming)/AMP-acid ligase II/thioesterase domain-containing protein/acyl carrier protein